MYQVVEVYDAMSGVWRQEQPMHQKRERFGSAVMESCVFVAGGFTEDGRPTSHVEVLVYEPLSY
jgi:hypothetical protein